jgi:hypothetical protein
MREKVSQYKVGNRASSNKPKRRLDVPFNEECRYMIVAPNYYLS